MRHDPRDLLIFARVVELQGLTAAAASLGIAKASVSRAISRIERNLRVRLLDRSSRHCRTTDEGLLFYERCRAVSEAVEQTNSVSDLIQGHYAGEIRIRSTITIGQMVLAVLMPRFQMQNPSLSLRLDLSYRPIDLMDGTPDLYLVPGPLSDAGLTARSIGTFSYGLYASPSYLEKTPVSTPQELAGLTVVDNCQGRPLANWNLISNEHRIVVRPRVGLDLSDSLLRREAIIQGAGIGLLPRWICADALASNRLVPVLPDWHVEARASLYIAWRSQTMMRPHQRAFVDYLIHHIPVLLKGPASCSMIGRSLSEPVLNKVRATGAFESMNS